MNKIKKEMLSRNEINYILHILFNYKDSSENVQYADIIKVLYLFEDKEKTDREREEFMKNCMYE